MEILGDINNQYCLTIFLRLTFSLNLQHQWCTECCTPLTHVSCPCTGPNIGTGLLHKFKLFSKY
uniref:Uncharacterized protein n=1 Tax=Anguilla anguilla TaxID=7936 RepID=A0A0E9W7N3_ANGAN